MVFSRMVVGSCPTKSLLCATIPVDIRTANEYILSIGTMKLYWPIRFLRELGQAYEYTSEQSLLL